MRIDRVGEVNRANNGMLMKIVAYRLNDDIDVQFENGITVYNKAYGDFKKGHIGLPQQDRTGEVRRANNGMMMKIIAYRSSYDIDIQFEDGAVVYNKRYCNFKRGSIGHPKVETNRVLLLKDRVGEEGISNDGMKMKIIAYRTTHDIDVQFEDGSIAYNRTYANFKKGKIEYPKASGRVGEVVKAINGMLMEIVAYRSSKDIDIRFEDGTLVYNKSYNNFSVGRIGYPLKNSLRVGEESLAINGMKMKIIAYRSNVDIDIQFEDGTVVYNKRYSNFKRGSISNPKTDSKIRKNELNRVGKINRSKNGMLMKIVGYRSCDDIDIQFEDGLIVKNKKYRKFCSGFIEYSLENFHGFTNIKKSFEYNGMMYYLCRDSQGKGQIYTLQQMMKIAGVKPAF